MYEVHIPYLDYNYGIRLSPLNRGVVMSGTRKCIEQCQDFLKQVNSFDNLKKWKIIGDDEKVLDSGTFNVIKSVEMQGDVSVEQVDKSSPNKVEKVKPKIVVASVRENINMSDEDKLSVIDARNKEITNSQAVLKDVSSPFVSKQIYYDDHGNRVQSQAVSSLLAFITNQQEQKLTVTPRRFRILIAQMLLGVEALHKSGVVHRDIKPGNFLVFHASDKTPLIQIADLDSVTKINNQTGQCITLPDSPTGSYRHPELDEYFVEKNGAIYSSQQKWNEDKDRLSQADFRAWDAFALGESIVDMARYLPVSSRSDAEYNALVGLVYFLHNQRAYDKNVDPIGEAKESPFFGGTKEIRKKFFEEVTSDATNQETYFDSYYYKNTPEKGDAFLLLPSTIKEISLKAKTIENNLQSFCERRENQEEISSVESRVIVEQIQAVNKLIDMALQSKDADVNLCMHLYRLQESLQKEANDIRRSALSDLVNKSLKIYLDSFEYMSLFSSHGRSGKKRAISFVNSLQDLSTEAMQLELNKFIQDPTIPAKQGSFKTILAAHCNPLLGTLEFNKAQNDPMINQIESKLVLMEQKRK